MTQKTRLRIFALASIVASLAGIGYAVFLGTACDGGRGGAVAVALAFGALFTSRPLVDTYVEKAKASEDEGARQAPVEDRLRTLEGRTDNLQNALAILVDRQRLETLYLTLASVSGTLVWGFGDMIAERLGAAPCS